MSSLFADSDLLAPTPSSSAMTESRQEFSHATATAVTVFFAIESGTPDQDRPSPTTVEILPQPTSVEGAVPIDASGTSSCQLKGALVDDRLCYQPNSKSANASPGVVAGSASGGLFAVGLNDTAALGELSVQAVPLPASGLSNSAQSFWYDRTTIYGFQDQRLMAFEVGNDNGWEKVEAKGASSVQVDSRDPMFSDPDYGRSFKANLRYEADKPANVVMLDTSQDGPMLKTFETFETYDAQGVVRPSRDGQSIFFVPAGEQGILLAIGGISNEQSLSMNNIGMLDISTGTWSNINATVFSNADPPGSRSDFCGWVSAAPDRASYSITIHGGRDRYPPNNVYGDIWTLSVPSFTWIKINNQNGDNEISHRRHSHQCLKQGSHMGFVLGGSNRPEDVCPDPFEPNLSLVDLSTLQFVDSFDPEDASDDYRIPQAISDAIVGKGPVNEDIRKIFAQAQLQPISSPATTHGPGAKPTHDSSQASSAKDGGLSTAAKAGIGLGAAIGLILILLAALFFLRRRRRALERRNGFSTSPAMTKSMPAPGDEADEEDNFVSAHAHHVEEQYRRSVSPPGGLATQMPDYVHGSSRTFTREEIESPSSTYSDSLLEDHDGQDREHAHRTPEDGRRLSAVSSLAETLVHVDNESAHARGESALSRRIGGDVSPVLSPVSPVETRGRVQPHDGFELERDGRAGR